ncbi:MAG: hypothetical protein J7L19_05820 [Dehalococcoidia bacterium]|nr:hypothetical protein [Dehalococcoidia bacterium]
MSLITPKEIERETVHKFVQYLKRRIKNEDWDSIEERYFKGQRNERIVEEFN